MSVQTEGTISDLESFFRTYYDEEIGKLAQKYPKDSKTLQINYQDFFQYDPDLAEDLKENPESAIEHFKATLSDYDIPVADVSFEDANIRFHGFGRTRSVSGLRSEDVNKLVAVEGIVRKRTEVRPEVQKAVFECERCGTTTTITQDGGDLREPYECKGCERQGPFNLLFNKSEFIDHQRIKLQESPEGSGGTEGRDIEVVVRDDLVDEAKPGNRAIIVGTLRAETDDQTTFDLYIEGNNVIVEEDDFEDLDIDEEEERKIKEIADSDSDDDDVYEKLVDSIAPSIYGYETEKMALALQLFGGVRKELPDGTIKRGNIHSLLVGDPGTGKSQLLQYAENIAPRAVYTSGKGTTAAGLTASAVKDDFGDTKWTLEAGALVLADKGIACIDELDKMSDEDRSAMHDALSTDQTISVAKAGINATLKSRCALFGAANPKYGRFDEYEGIAEQIDLEPALISRFDLIFTVTDEPDKEDDAQLADYLGKINFAGQVKASDGDLPDSHDEIEPEIDPDLLQKYIAYARANVKPKRSEETWERLNNFYVSLRDSGGDDTIAITPRKLEALYRLAEASARARLSEEITVEDAERAIDIVKESLRDVSYDPETDMLDADIVETGHSSSQRKRVRVVRQIIAEIQEEEGKAHVEDIKERASEEGVEEPLVNQTLITLETNGEVMKPEEEYYRVV